MLTERQARRIARTYLTWFETQDKPDHGCAEVKYANGYLRSYVVREGMEWVQKDALAYVERLATARLDRKDVNPVIDAARRLLGEE